LLFAGDSQIRMIFRRLTDSVSPILTKEFGSPTVNGEDVNEPEEYPFFGHKDFELVWTETGKNGPTTTRCAADPRLRHLSCCTHASNLPPPTHASPGSCCLAKPAQNLVLVDSLRLQHDRGTIWHGASCRRACVTVQCVVNKPGGGGGPVDTPTIHRAVALPHPHRHRAHCC
jgi:hypothetical protein